MKALTLIILSALAGCGVKEQPASLETVAAYEVPLPTANDKARFVQLLEQVSAEQGYHVDVATPDELKMMSEVSPISFNATVWRGNDEEDMASAMDFQDRIGRVWIGFPKGEAPDRSRAFRDRLLPLIQQIWPETAALPIMPNGSIPLTGDLIRGGSAYQVKPSAEAKYAKVR